jgi:hypothetical protein
MSRTILLGVAALLGGCMVHLPKNAPGRIDPRQPPAQPACREVETPGDPGEHQVTLSTGVLLGGGGAFGRPPGEKGMMALSVETTLHWGQRATSHNENPPLFPGLSDRYYPPRSFAVTLGAQLLEAGDWGRRVGHLYAEFQVFAIDKLASGAALGWAVDPQNGHTGPQVTLFTMGILFVRFDYLIHGGAQLTGGMQLKIPVSWTWSR